MVFPVKSPTDAGTSTLYGAADLTKYANLLNGVLNVDSVDINSSFTFRDAKLKIRNPGNTFAYILRAQAITGDRDLTLPLLSSNDEVVCASATQTLRNKTILASENTISGSTPFPASKKFGVLMCSSNIGSGFGILSGVTLYPVSTPPVFQRSASGTYWTFSTGTNSLTKAGWQLETLVTRREWTPRFKVKSQVLTTTSNRLYQGLTTDSTLDMSQSSALNNTNSGVMVGWRETDANIRIFVNSGTSTTPISPTIIDTGIAKNTTETTYEINFTNSGNTCTVTITNPTGLLYTQTITNNLPATSFSLCPVVFAVNTSSTNTDLRLYYSEIESAL